MGNRLAEVELYGKGHPYNDLPFVAILDRVVKEALFYPPARNFSPHYNYGATLSAAFLHLKHLEKAGLSENESNLRKMFGYVDENGFANNVNTAKVIEEIRKEELGMSNDNAIQLFNFNNNQVRILIKDGEPWFVVNDVCSALEIANPYNVVARLPWDALCQAEVIDSLGRTQNTNVVNEAGLYELIFRSDKPEAQRFRRWVTHEVLPSIRKHGAYMTPQKIEEALLNPDTIIKLCENLKAEQEKNRGLRKTIDQDRPKVLFADSVAASETSILIGDLAKLLHQNGVETGQKRLFEWLRNNGYLMKTDGESFNMPTQRSMEMDLFEIKERVINNPDGSIRITKTAKVTGKGQLYFTEKFLGKKAA